MTPQQHSAADWQGQAILDRAGERIGTIEDIYLVEETGRPDWALVKVGKLKSHTTLVPLENANPSEKGVKVDYEKKLVSDAPRVGDDEPSEQEVIALYRHYGLDPHGRPAEAKSADEGSASPPQHDERAGGAREARPQAGRSQAQQSGTGATLKRTAKEFSEDKLPHWAAALTYYAVLSIFPALLAIVSILGLIGSSAVQPLIDNLGTVAPGPAKEILTGALQGLQQSGGSGVLFIVALAGAIWAASGYIGAFMDASNTVYDIEEGRPILKKLPLRVGITVLMLVLLTASAVAVVLTGPVAEQVGSLLGVGDAALSVWDVVKWPVLVLIVAFMLAVLYYATPNVKQPGMGSVVPGGVLAVVLWIAVSVAFAFYVANFGSYNKTYGSLGGVIVFLVWLWLTNLAILLGAEFNAERARARHIERGHPAGDEPYLQPRSSP